MENLPPLSQKDFEATAVGLVANFGEKAEAHVDYMINKFLLRQDDEGVSNWMNIKSAVSQIRKHP